MNNAVCVNLPFKNSVWAIVLSLILGPIGIAYTSIKVSLIMLVITALIGMAGQKMSWLLMVIWIVNMYIHLHLVARYNRKLLESIR